MIKFDIYNMNRLSALRAEVVEMFDEHPAFSIDIAGIVAQYAQSFRGECVLEYKGHRGGVLCVVDLGGGLVASSGSSAIHVWNSETGMLVRELNGHRLQVTFLVAVGDRRLLASSSYMNIRLWDWVSGRCLKLFHFKMRMGILRSMVVFPGLKQFATVCSKYVQTWDMLSGECTKTLKMDAYVMDTLYQGRMFVTGGQYSCQIVKTSSGECVQKFIDKHSNGYTTAILVLSDNKRVVSATSNGLVYVWDVNSNTYLEVFEGLATNIIELPDGRLVTCDSNSDEDTLCILDMKEMTRQTLKSHTQPTTSVANLSNDRVISGSFDGTVRIWE